MSNINTLEEDKFANLEKFLDTMGCINIIIDDLNKNSAEFVGIYKKFNDTSNLMREEILRLQKENADLPDRISDIYKDSITAISKINSMQEELIACLSKHETKMHEYTEILKNHNKKLENMDNTHNLLTKKLDSQENNLSKIYSEIQDMRSFLNINLSEINANVVDLTFKELKNINNNLVSISKTTTKLDSKINGTKDYANKAIEASEEVSIIKMMITDAKSEIIAAVAGQTSATELAVPRKSSQSKKKNERQIDKALGVLRGQFSYLNTDNDLEEAVEEFIGSAEEEVSSGAIRYVSEESNLNVVKDGRNGRRAWRGNYHTNINEIVIPLDDVDDQLEPNLNIVLLGKNIKNGKVDSIRSMKISELDDYALLSD